MRILIPLADGFEEIEAVTTIDVLRRAGLDVTTMGLAGTMVRGSRGVSVIADKKISDVNDIEKEFDALVLVGGSPGYANLGKSNRILDVIRRFDEKKKTIAAICAAPSLLQKAGILQNRKATIYPGMEREIARPREGRVVVDDNIITSQGPGTAMEFAFKIVETLLGPESVIQLKEEMVC